MDMSSAWRKYPSPAEPEKTSLPERAPPCRMTSSKLKLMPTPVPPVVSQGLVVGGSLSKWPLIRIEVGAVGVVVVVVEESEVLEGVSDVVADVVSGELEDGVGVLEVVIDVGDWLHGLASVPAIKQLRATTAATRTLGTIMK